LKSGEFFFPEDPNLADDDFSSVGDATLEAFVRGQLRMKTTGRTNDSGNKRVRSDDDSHDSLTFGTTSSADSDPTISLHQPFGEHSKRSRKKKDPPPMTPVQEEEKMDATAFDEQVLPRDPSGDKAKASGEAFQNHKSTTQPQDESSIVEDTDEVDDDDGNNDGDDEMSFHSPVNRSINRASHMSVAESLAEAFGLYNACGALRVGPKRSSSGSERPVPKTLEPDLLSVGELTAATLERHVAAGNSSKTSPTRCFASGGDWSFLCAADASGTTNTASDEDVTDKGVASTPIRFATSQSSTLFGRTNSVLSCGDRNATNSTENYFAEYEDCGIRDGSVFLGGNDETTNSSKTAATKRIDPPATKLAVEN